MAVDTAIAAAGRCERGPGILLLGDAAEALAARLSLSGYVPIGQGDLGTTPAAVILSPDRAGVIGDLRKDLGDLPVLLGVTDDTVEARAHCLGSGADDFWLTHLGPSHLLTRLRLLLARKPPGSCGPSLRQEGDLRIDLERHQVWRGTRQVLLSPREFQLLALLLDQKGLVVSRQRILQEVWDDQQSGASNVIEVYIRYLRKKLEADGEPRVIHTIRGLGYSLTERAPGLNPHETS